MNKKSVNIDLPGEERPLFPPFDAKPEAVHVKKVSSDYLSETPIFAIGPNTRFKSSLPHNSAPLNLGDPKLLSYDMRRAYTNMFDNLEAIRAKFLTTHNETIVRESEKKQPNKKLEDNCCLSKLKPSP